MKINNETLKYLTYSKNKTMNNKLVEQNLFLIKEKKRNEKMIKI